MHISDNDASNQGQECAFEIQNLDTILIRFYGHVAIFELVAGSLPLELYAVTSATALYVTPLTGANSTSIASARADVSLLLVT